jgi:hypothetical protein
MRRAIDGLLLAAIVAFGAWLRFDRLAQPSLWLDEILDYDLATKFAAGPWWRWLTGLASEHGRLFFASELAGRVARAPELSARLWPALFGVAAIAVIWLAARALPQFRSAAPAAALLLAGSPFHVYFSREARPYALLMLIAAALLVVLLRRPSIAIAIAILAAALFTTSGAAPLLVATAIAAAIAWYLRRDRFYAQFAIASAIAASLVPLFYRQPPTTIASAPFTFATQMQRQEWIVFALAAVGAVALLRRDRIAGAIAVAMAVLPAAISLLALAVLRHWYASRYVAAALPAYLLLAAIGIVAIVRLEPLAVAGAALVLIPGWTALRSEPLRKLDWRAIAQTIHAHAKSGDIVLATNEWSAACLRFYLPKELRLLSADESIDRARRVVATHQPVWIVDAGFHERPAISAWACRYPIVLASKLESFRLHYAPDLRHLLANRVTAADARALAARYPSHAVNFAPSDDVYLGAGWYGAEKIGDQWARWSAQSSDLTLITAAADHRVTFRALPISPPQHASIALNGANVAEVDLGPEWRDYAIDVPRGGWRDGVNMLTFRFTRATVPGQRDPRLLSAMFDSIAVGSGDSPPAEVARYFRIDAPLLDPPSKKPSRFADWNDAKLAPLLGRLGFDPQTTLPRLRRREMTIEELADTFAEGTECLSDQEFLKLAWPVMIGRPTDAFGERDFLRALRRTMTRSRAVLGLAKSPEFRERLH